MWEQRQKNKRGRQRARYPRSPALTPRPYLPLPSLPHPPQPQDGRTIRYPDPLIAKSDTVKIDLASGKVTEFLKFEVGNTVMITKGRNTGRVGTLVKIDSHPGSFDIAQVKDAEGNTFATRKGNVFSIGKGSDQSAVLISLPRGKGIKRTIFVSGGERGAGFCVGMYQSHYTAESIAFLTSFSLSLSLAGGARQARQGAEGIETLVLETTR